MNKPKDRVDHIHKLPPLPSSFLKRNTGQGLMFKAICPDCWEEVTWTLPPIPEIKPPKNKVDS